MNGDLHHSISWIVILQMVLGLFPGGDFLLVQDVVPKHTRQKTVHQLDSNVSMYIPDEDCLPCTPTPTITDNTRFIKEARVADRGAMPAGAVERV
jgi:hypothetical protein